MNPLIDRKAWRAHKKALGIPDGVCKFSIGEKLDGVAKGYQALTLNDLKAEHALLEGALAFLKTYKKALKDVEEAKFKGKSASEQKGSKKKALKVVDDLLTSATSRHGFLTGALEPMKHLVADYGRVAAAWPRVDTDDDAAVKDFYSVQMRNVLGQPVKQARKLKLGSKVLAALEGYEDLMGEVNAWFSDSNDLTAKEAWTKMGEALELIEPYMK